MPTIEKKSNVQPDLLFMGPDQSVRANCKEGSFYNTNGTIELPLDYLDLVIVAYDICQGPLPPIDPEKLREKDGPLRHHNGAGAIIPNLSKATDQEIAQVIFDHLLKVRGMIWGFVVPSTHQEIIKTAPDVLIQKLIMTMNFHGVSVERAAGGFATYLFNLAANGNMPYEVITRVYFDESHAAPSGEMLKGLYFQSVEPTVEQDATFLAQVVNTLETENIVIPDSWLMGQCFSLLDGENGRSLDNYYKQRQNQGVIRQGILKATVGSELTYDDSTFIKESVFTLPESEPILLLDEGVETLDVAKKEAIPF